MDNSKIDCGNDSVDDVEVTSNQTETAEAGIVHDVVSDSSTSGSEDVPTTDITTEETPLTDDIKELIKVHSNVLLSDVKSCVMKVLNMWPNFFGFELALTGSGADGTLIYTDNYQSDGDIMFVPMDTEITEDSLEYIEELPCYVTIKSNGLNSKLNQHLTEDGQYLNATRIKTLHKPVIEGLLQKMNFFETKVGLVVGESAEVETPKEDEHISCSKTDAAKELNFTKLHVDLVPQIKLKDCPRIAQEFFSREGRTWPKKSVLDEIRAGPFHVVPRLSPVYHNDELDFCLSFTKAELKLAESMVPPQKSCMKALKLVIHSFEDSSDILTTYHIKTALYWVSETSDISIWKYDRTLRNIRKVLQFLLECISRRHLSHFFVRDSNLFYGKTDDDFSDVKPQINELINSESAIRLHWCKYYRQLPPAVAGGV